MIISHIVAVSSNFVIGKDNKLPWRMPDDARYFHQVTKGHIVIMGRRNYEANKKALPGRTNIVITRNQNFNPGDAILARNIEEAIEIARKDLPVEIFIVGGGEIYKQSLSLADRIYITIIDKVFLGDTYYPEIKIEDYNVISKIAMKADQQNPYDHTYYILETKL